MRSGVVLALLPALAGCVTSKPVNLPNGQIGYVIQCDGAARDMGDCMNHAGKLCGGPYQVVNNDESSSAAMGMPVGTGYMVVPAQKRRMVIQCAPDPSIKAELDAFAADPKHPHFWRVKDYMGALLTSGEANSLEEAYQLAVLRSGLK